MRIVWNTTEFATELREFLCATVQRRRDEDGFRGTRGGKANNVVDDLESDGGNRLVCIIGGVSYLGNAVVDRLLVHGYSVRIVVDNPEDAEKVRETRLSRETTSFKDRISAVMARLTNIESLIEAFDGCGCVFHTSAFVDPAGISGYSKFMAEIEVKVSKNVIEACSRTETVRKCIFTSSLLACIWRDSSVSDPPSIVNEESWSEEQFCKEQKLWYALGKLKAEKTAWRIAEANGLKFATICPGLITGSDFFLQNSTSTLFYLKGAREMYANGLLATVDVNKLAKAHVFVLEGLSQSAFGRYICFDNVLGRDGAETLCKEIGVQTEKICGDLDRETPAPFELSNKKLLDLMSRTLRSCYQES